jgi:hypothetical protein
MASDEEIVIFPHEKDPAKRRCLNIFILNFQ